MAFTPLIRPTENNGVRLYYRQAPKFNPTKFNSHGIVNMVMMVRLYRKFYHLDSTVTMLPKDHLHSELFSNDPAFKIQQLGRVLNAVVPYKLGFQENARKSNGYKGTMWFRWQNKLEIVYGLEYFMATTWLPSAIKANDEKVTAEVLEEELEILRDMNLQEEQEMFQYLQDQNFWRFQGDYGPRFSGETETVMDEDTGEEWTIPKKKWTQ